MMATTFWHPDGTPMSAQQFLELLFGKLPEFFKDEAELRAIWSAPDTRARLLQGLAEKGFGRDQMAEMQKIIDAEKSDLFDVLAHVAYALPPVTREVRAANAKVYINTRFTAKQQVFLDFVLSHYVTVGVEELDQEKLTPLLRLKYHDSIADAVADLGKPEEIGTIFATFQKYLYQPAARISNPGELGSPLRTPHPPRLVLPPHRPLRFGLVPRSHPPSPALGAPPLYPSKPVLPLLRRPCWPVSRRWRHAHTATVPQSRKARLTTRQT